MTLRVNGEAIDVELDPAKPLLWVLREELGLTGTKYGCGVAACGACTIHLDGRAVRSCILPADAAEGAEITTIEAVSGGAAGVAGQLAQQAWIEMQVPQCGYCQSGMIMAVAALLGENPNPSDDEIDAAVTNICRCGTYPRIRKAVHAVARHMETAS
ncbi:(2Fe-2S)-binding protein [Aquamicrobium sp. LC103]|nr:(2Fe-2S)-binding protein [Aquamicrobium sp. LC103]